MTEDQGRWSDEDLERAMRRGLDERARSMPASSERGVASRPARRWPVVAAAAAAVIGIAVLAPFALRGDGNQEPPSAAEPTTTTSATPTATDGGQGTLPDGWRWESYEDVSVAVPADWGWGGGPQPGGDYTEGAPIDCGSGAYVVPGTKEYENVPDGAAYVGRPVTMTDACNGVVPDRPQGASADFVLLGSLYRLGTGDAGNGYTFKTVEAGPSNVTVVTKDPALGEQILATLRINRSTDPLGCRVQPVADRATGTAGAEATWTGMSVCVYPGEGMGVMGSLLYSARFDAETTQAYVDALAAHPSRTTCEVDHPSTLVVIKRQGTLASGEQKVWQDVTTLADCGGRSTIETADGSAALVRATAQPWAGDGILAYVNGQGDLEWTDLFRGTLG